MASRTVTRNFNPSFLGSLSRKTYVIIGLITVLIIVAITSVLLSQPDKDVYHGVFLDNGQVYFAKIKSQRALYLDIYDIHYLRSQTSLQEAETDKPLSLVKVGNELHGPQDSMRINQEHVLFIQPLRNDSQVVHAILKDR